MNMNRLKVLVGKNQGKIGEVIDINTYVYDENGNFQQCYQVLKFEDGSTEKFPLYHVGMLENLNFKGDGNNESR